MPIYNYKCKCGKEIEELVMPWDVDGYEPVCQCGNKDLKRIYKAPAVRCGRRQNEMKTVEDDSFEQKGVDNTKEYEILHDKPRGGNK